VRKLILKTYDFVDISNATIPTALGGSTTTSPPIMVVILRQQLDYDIVDYSRADHTACNIPGLETRNCEENDMCIAFMHLKTWKFFAQVI
jgi:hypothetical protein